MHNKLYFLLFCGTIAATIIMPASARADQADTLYKEGLALEKKGQRDFAVFKYFTITRNYPNSRWADESLFKIGEFYYENKDYFNAKNTFEELILKYPQSQLVKDADAYLENITIMSRKIDIESSIKYIISAIENYKSENKWDKMADECDKLLAFEPLAYEYRKKLTEYYKLCGDAYVKQGSLDKAKTIYEKLIKITPDDTEVLNTLYEINKLLRTTEK